MRLIYLIILGILLVGIVTAVTFSLSDSNFTEEITTISSSLFYDKLVSMDKMDSKDVPKDTTLEVPDSLEIKQDPKTGVTMVQSK